MIFVLIWIGKMVYLYSDATLYVSVTFVFNDTKTKMYELSVKKNIPLHVAESYLICGSMEWNKVIVIVPT